MREGTRLNGFWRILFPGLPLHSLGDTQENHEITQFRQLPVWQTLRSFGPTSEIQVYMVISTAVFFVVLLYFIGNCEEKIESRDRSDHFLTTCNSRTNGVINLQTTQLTFRHVARLTPTSAKSCLNGTKCINGVNKCGPLKLLVVAVHFRNLLRMGSNGAR